MHRPPVAVVALRCCSSNSLRYKPLRRRSSPNSVHARWRNIADTPHTLGQLHSRSLLTGFHVFFRRALDTLTHTPTHTHSQTERQTD
ncbi:unnamed protein product [Heligmosomoides polygyrus]|uniref:Secreted protein n=1 Tax=Heligmosomoides polygyrus TaxID=6339 RepID=A0A183FAV6_HELPZ|nr:unnamed protein product [Heligmosomoides polygyrus]